MRRPDCFGSLKFMILKSISEVQADLPALVELVRKGGEVLVEATLRAARRCFTARVSADRYKRLQEVRLVCSEESRIAAERAPVVARLFAAMRPR